MGSFSLLLLYAWAVQPIRGVFHLVISSICWFRIIRVLICVFGVSIADKVDGVGDQKWGDTTVVHVQTLLEAFVNISLRSACFIREVFFWQKFVGLLSSSAGLSVFPNYQTLDYKNLLCLFPSMFSCMNFRLTINSTWTQIATGFLN